MMMAQSYPDKYYRSPREEKEPLAPLWFMSTSLLLELIIFIIVFFPCLYYFLSQKVVQTTISPVLLDNQVCATLIPKNGIVRLSTTTSENAQFAAATMNHDRCVETLVQADICNNVFPFLSLSGFSNTNNSMYYANYAFSFNPTNNPGLSTTFGVFHNPSTSFPVPVLDIPGSYIGESTLYYMNLTTMSIEPYNPDLNFYNGAFYTMLDFEKGTFYDTSGRGKTNTPPNITIQIPIHNYEDTLEKLIGNKLLDLVIHDDIYYGITTEVFLDYPNGVAVDIDGNAN